MPDGGHRTERLVRRHFRIERWRIVASLYVFHGNGLATFEAADTAFEAMVDAASSQTRRYPDQPIGEHATHDWWYRCLQRAGIVPKGVTRGAKMHGARHTAAQRILDTTGNLKAAQVALGHSSLSTTSDHYVDQNDQQRLDAMRATIGGATLDETLLHRAGGAS